MRWCYVETFSSVHLAKWRGNPDALEAALRENRPPHKRLLRLDYETYTLFMVDVLDCARKAER